MSCLRRTLIAAVAVIGCSTVPAKAFECSGVKLPSNVVICSDPELIRLADERQQVFNEARWGADGTSLLSPQQDKELWENQKSWVRSYAAACGVPPDGPTPRLPVSPGILQCFKEAAEARIAFLRQYRAQASDTPAVPPVAGTRIGPGFDCSAASHDTLAQMVCADPDLARTDLRFNQAFWALLQQLDEAHRRQLKQEDVEFLEQVHAQCGVPHLGGLTPEVLSARSCVKQAYEAERSQWISRLSGPAYEEATRPIDEHIRLERRLRQLALLTSPPIPEGVYGPSTRRAISEWQRTNGRSVTGLLSNADALALGSGNQIANPTRRVPDTSPTTVWGDDIPLKASGGGTYTVPVVINGVLPLQFVVDSGAADVSLPGDVVLTLMRTGTITNQDFIGSRKYRLADGSMIDSNQFYLRELKVGGHTISRVEASVSRVDSTPLLGQSFLAKFDSWAMDNKRHVLVLRVGDQSAMPTPQSNTSDEPQPLGAKQ